jgi:AcrR family transcriptional regulator
VGIVQSGFYAHFKTIEACLHALVHEIDLNVRQPIAEQMAKLRLTDAGDPALLEEFYTQLFKLVEQNWPLMEVFLHYRGDHSIVGKMLHDFESSLVEDLTQHLSALRDVRTLQPAFDQVSTENLNVISHMMLNQCLVGIYHWKIGNIEKHTLVKLLSQHISKIGESSNAAGIGVPRINGA